MWLRYHKPGPELKKTAILLMDDYSRKRASGGFGIVGRGSALGFRDASNHDDRTVSCNRLVCSNRHNFMKSSQVGNSDRDKYSSSSCTSPRSIVGSSSRAYSAVTNHKKDSLYSQNPSSHKAMLSTEANNIHLENLSSEPSSSTARVPKGLPAAEDTESSVLDGSVNASEVENYNLTLHSRTQKQIYRQSGQGHQEVSVGSSSLKSFVPKKTGQATKTTSHGQSFYASRSSSSTPQSNRYGLRNLGCSSISDVLPSSSSRDSSQNGRAEMVKRRNSTGECSSPKGKNVSASSSAGNFGSRKNSVINHSLSLPERPPSQPTSRRTRYWLPSRNGVTSVRTRSTINEDSRSRVSEHGNYNNLSRTEPPVVTPILLQNDMSDGDSSTDSSQQSLTEVVTEHSVTGRNSVQLGGRDENVCRSPVDHPHGGSSQQLNGLSIERDGYQHYNRAGIAEVLLALERIEQDEELTYEQLLVLETNLFLSGLGFRDQHRDMRLDIDNMSYEELLALGEKMGTVSTGLTEEKFSNCLKRSFYMPAPPNFRIRTGGDDAKCSVCQEEYAEGDEMGNLRCDHHYHLVCINQWLRLKNWCPICKAQAADL
ncbi:hypothetical protein IFM89_029024 [Coptis chinensis]|uniref:RING-type E3 ubiquitin transferase n=1 Tax=Coptis chinensis TaxID=261450 RepID=A0A835IGQ1_9MAGN|nr:hypothetical protein IFM89_029024 [Coptis chinensis]